MFPLTRIAIVIITVLGLAGPSALDPTSGPGTPAENAAHQPSPAPMTGPDASVSPEATGDRFATVTDPRDAELLQWAQHRFHAAGLELPDVPVTFPSDSSECFGYGGVYLKSSQSVKICRPSKATIIHELAHAWIETSFDETDRQAFLTLRGLSGWDDRDLEWSERGAEQAAEIITWALMDTDITVRWDITNPDGTTTTTRRLFKIPDSDPTTLTHAYHQLTGQHPTGQHPTGSETVSPEASGSETVSPEASGSETVSPEAKR